MKIIKEVKVDNKDYVYVQLTNDNRVIQLFEDRTIRYKTPAFEDVENAEYWFEEYSK